MRRFNIIVPGKSYWFLWVIVGVLLGFGLAGKMRRKGSADYTVHDRAGYVVIDGPRDFHVKVYK